jgi:hypothetical protein
MKFNSQSVLLNRGVNYRFPIKTPPAFNQYKFSPDVLKRAVTEFNKKLNKRPHVTMHLDTQVKVDVLRVVNATEDTLALWLVVKEKDIDTLHEKCFTITGDVYFAGESEVNVDEMVIKDVMFEDNKGIFTKG